MSDHAKCAHVTWEEEYLCDETARLRARLEAAEKERDEALGERAKSLRDRIKALAAEWEAGGIEPLEEDWATLSRAARALRSALSSENMREGEKQGLVLAESRSSARMEAVKFFASVIKSGEPWTKACDDAYAKALAEVSPKGQAPAPGVCECGHVELQHGPGTDMIPRCWACDETGRSLVCSCLAWRPAHREGQTVPLPEWNPGEETP